MVNAQKRSLICFQNRNLAKLIEGGAKLMYAIIETGGKQYKVSEGDVIFVEKLNAEEGAAVKFDKALMPRLLLRANPRRLSCLSISPKKAKRSKKVTDRLTQKFRSKRSMRNL